MVSQNIKTFISAALNKNAAVVKEALVSELKAKAVVAIENAKTEAAREFFIPGKNNAR